jgi:hypothetical protein
MTIRARYHLAILPLFAGLGLVNALLFFFIERREIIWGLTERAQSTAISVAGFAGVIDLGSAEPSPALSDLSQRMDGLSVSWFNLAGGQWKEVPVMATGGLRVLPPGADAMAALTRGAPAASYRAQPDFAYDESLGYAGVPAADGSLRAVVGISEKDTTLREGERALVRKGLVLCAVALGAGLVVAEFLTRLARREIDRLVGAAGKLVRSEYNFTWETGHIREINDLGGTLDTMASILGQSIRQTKRKLFQAELLPRDRELARSCQEFCDAQSGLAADRVHCAIRRVGEANWDDFFNVRETPAGWWIIAGRCAPSAASVRRLDRIIHANAARDFLSGLVVARSPHEFWPEFQALFPCLALHLLFIPRDGTEPVGHVLGIGGRLGAWPLGECRGAFGTLSADTFQLVESYLRPLTGRNLEALADDLANLLVPREAGVLVLYDFSPVPTSILP